MKGYFDLELRTTVINAVFGAISGYISFIINSPLYSSLLALVILGAIIFLMKKSLKIEKDFKWWLSNAILIFLFSWLIVWTIFHTLRMWSTIG